MRIFFYNAESLCEALLFWPGCMVLEISFSGAREAAVWIRGFDHTIGLVQDLFGILDERFDFLDKLCFVDSLAFLPLRICKLDML
jgi:hypothetical protein